MMTVSPEASSSGGRGHHKRIYQPEEWRESAFTIYGEADVPAYWSGWIPDPAAQRRTVSWAGDACVPGGLLRGGFHDMSVLVWAQIFSWFREQEGQLNYIDLAEALYQPPITVAHMAQISAAMQPLLGSWILRRRGRQSQVYRLEFSEPRGERGGFLRREQFAELRVGGRTQDRTIFPADLVNFARWRRECTNGWTVESTRLLAEKWRVDHSAVRASRDRLAHLGWLLVLPRERQASDEDWLVWISELYDPDLEMVELEGSSRSYASSRLRPSGEQNSVANGFRIEAIDATALRDYLQTDPASQSVTLSLEQLHQLLHPTVPAAQWMSTGWWRETLRSRWWTHATEDFVAAIDMEQREVLFKRPAAPAQPSLTELRLARARRRRRALLDLMSPQHHPIGNMPVRARPHDVYLIHFPEEGCFKVGLTHSTSHRINQFSRHGGIVVDRVTVDNKFLAEIIEVDVLSLTEDWHRLGDRQRPGKGYTEMWSDRGPTVDLERVKLQTTQLVTHIADLLDRGLT